MGESLSFPRLRRVISRLITLRTSHAYAYRDRSGDAVTLARPKPYGKPFLTTSTIGILLLLPTRPPIPSSKFLDPLDPSNIIRKRVPIRYKGELFYESLEYGASREMGNLVDDPTGGGEKVDGSKQEEKKAAPGTKSISKKLDTTPPPRPLPILPGSKIIFFVDGVCQGVAFSDLFDFLPLRLDENDSKRKTMEKVQSADGRLNVLENFNDDGALGYYPIVSVFGGGVATLNPGPEFEFSPPLDLDSAIATSPNPISHPSTPLLQSSTKIRPLSERYEEFYAEQASLDDLDELESIETYRALLLVESNKLSNPGTGGKRSKLGSTSSRIESNSAAMRFGGTAGGESGLGGGGMEGGLRTELLLSGMNEVVSRRGSESGPATPVEISTPGPTDTAPIDGEQQDVVMQ